MMYNQRVLDYFFSPQHVGSIDLNQPFSVLCKNNQKGQGCIEWYMQCDQHGRIQNVCFKSNGNPYMIAGLEYLCRLMIGKRADSLQQIDYHWLVKELDIPLAQYPVALRITEVYKQLKERGNMMNVVMQHTKDIKPEISFTEAAIKHLESYLQKNSEYKGVRLSVKKTGCSGLSYVVDYVLTPMEDDLVLSLTDDCLVCIDKSSYPFLRNMKVDYVKQGLNYKFIFNNPNQTGQCGCGESFTVGTVKE